MDGGGQIETSIRGEASVDVYPGDAGEVIIEISLQGDDDGWMSAVLTEKETKRVGHEILSKTYTDC